jgi:MFS family permease
MANVVSVVFAAPLAAGIMSITALGLAGWQWLFILEGIPSVMLGAVMLVRPSTPASCCAAFTATLAVASQFRHASYSVMRQRSKFRSVMSHSYHLHAAINKSSGYSVAPLESDLPCVHLPSTVASGDSLTHQKEAPDLLAPLPKSAVLHCRCPNVCR